LKWILEGDDVLAKNLGVKVPINWSEFSEDIFKFSLDAINQNPHSKVWYTYLPIDIKSNTIIGTCGFKGGPKNGSVEIGYEVSKVFRNKGYATEMVNQLINIAFNNKEVRNIIAHTLPEENASVSVLKKCGFVYKKEIMDDEDGKLWRWKLRK